MVKKTEVDDESIITFECPVCDTEVSENDVECPDCGAIFEDEGTTDEETSPDEEEKEDNDIGKTGDGNQKENDKGKGITGIFNKLNFFKKNDESKDERNEPKKDKPKMLRKKSSNSDDEENDSKENDDEGDKKDTGAENEDQKVELDLNGDVSEDEKKDGEVETDEEETDIDNVIEVDGEPDEEAEDEFQELSTASEEEEMYKEIVKEDRFSLSMNPSNVQGKIPEEIPEEHKEWMERYQNNNTQGIDEETLEKIDEMIRKVNKLEEKYQLLSSKVENLEKMSKMQKEYRKMYKEMSGLYDLITANINPFIGGSAQRPSDGDNGGASPKDNINKVVEFCKFLDDKTLGNIPGALRYFHEIGWINNTVRNHIENIWRGSLSRYSTPKEKVINEDGEVTMDEVSFTTEELDEAAEYLEDIQSMFSGGSV